MTKYYSKAHNWQHDLVPCLFFYITYTTIDQWQINRSYITYDYLVYCNACTYLLLKQLTIQFRVVSKPLHYFVDDFNKTFEMQSRYSDNYQRIYTNYIERECNVLYSNPL